MTALAAAILIGSAMAAEAKPLTTMADVGSAILACWSPPAGTKGSSVTLQFSFKRDGSLFGEPRPTDIAVKGNDKQRKAFVNAAIGAVKKCTPLDFSDTLAKGIGGSVFTLDFHGADKPGSRGAGQNKAPAAR